MKSHFWGNPRKSFDFWEFFPLTFRIARFFSNSYFPQKTLYVNDWKIRIPKLILPKLRIWGKLTKSLYFWAFFPLTFRILAHFFSNLFFHKKTSYFIDWQNQNKLKLPQFYFWGKIFFSPNFQNCTFFCKHLFSQEEFYTWTIGKIGIN